MENKQIDFQDIIERLRNIEANMNFATAQSKSDYNALTIFSTIIRLYVYENSTNTYNRWCIELSTKINEILDCRKSKHGKQPTKKEVLKMLLDNNLLTRFKRVYDEAVNCGGKRIKTITAKQFEKLSKTFLTELLSSKIELDSELVNEIMKKYL